MINLSQENEPDIWNAIRRNALLENLTVDKKGKIDYADKSVTENTRVSYPIFHIENIVKTGIEGSGCQEGDLPLGRCIRSAAPGIDPDPEQTKYYFPVGLHGQAGGYGAWYHGADADLLGMFRAPSCRCTPRSTVRSLVKKMEKSGATAYLENTGWNGTGKRISIKDTRGIIDAILDGSIDKAPHEDDSCLRLQSSDRACRVLIRRSWIRATPMQTQPSGDEKAKDLAGRFIKNFTKFTGNEEGKSLVAAGPVPLIFAYRKFCAGGR